MTCITHELHIRCHAAEACCVHADKVRLLHLSVAVAFAEQLQKDDDALKEGRPEDVSLAPKWAPTPKGTPTLSASLSKITPLLGSHDDACLALLL